MGVLAPHFCRANFSLFSCWFRGKKVILYADADGVVPPCSGKVLLSGKINQQKVHHNEDMKKLFALCMLLLAWASVCAQNPDSLTFALTGNSISTYYDYIPQGYSCYYSAEREEEKGIQVGDTWWMQLSRLSGMSYLTNASWSGSRVACDALHSIVPFMSNERVKALGRAGKPDIIFVLGGTNDWYFSLVPLGEYRTENFTDSVTFRGAYTMLLDKFTRWYPESRIVCLSILPRGESASNKNSQGWSQADANASIKRIAQQFGQYYIDCTTVGFSSNWSKYTLDYLHPRTDGFTLLAKHIYKAMMSQRIITTKLKRSDEVAEAERLLDLSFTADGIVNSGTYDAKVGKHGTVTTMYDAASNTYYGCTKAKAADYFYATYDEGTPLAEAFNSNVTWEMLVRLDGVADQSGNIDRTCILGSEQDGGWAFYNSGVASSFCYTHKSGVKSSVKSITGDSILVPGKFYHLVLTMDRLSHTMRYFVNGKLVCTGTRAGTDMLPPQCGSVKGRKGMWICLGGDVKASTYLNGAENSSASSFVFVRVYDGALTQKAATQLYTDEVKHFTEPTATLGTELILDCEFTPSGAVNRAPGFLDRPVVMKGEVPINYNPEINLYESRFSKDKKQFFMYMLGNDPAVLSQLSDAYSVEVYCRSNAAKPTATSCPLGFLNGYGFGMQMTPKGGIGYATTTQGRKADKTVGKTQWIWTEDGKLNTDYTHYVLVYDRKNFRSYFYINGELVDTRWLSFKECPVYEWAPSAWLAIGGDAKGNYDAATTLGNYPFAGDISLVRVYGRALNEGEVQGLCTMVGTQEHTYTFGLNGYLPVCLPYVYRVPDGCQAYIVSEIASSVAMLKMVAESGEVVPYGTPVLLKGEPKTTITLSALNKDEMEVERLTALWPENLLAGTYSGKTLAAGEGFYIKATNTSPNIYRATSAVSLPPYSSYLPSTEKRTYYLLEEEPDGVRDVKGKGSEGKMSASIYDLSGRKLVVPQSGTIYIQNGKKKIK